VLSARVGNLLRKAILLTSILLLAGCTDADWAHVMSFDAPTSRAPATYPPDMPSAAAAANYSAYVAAPSVTKKCNDVADQRMNDAASQGFEDDVVQQVHDKTYADCMDWNTRHGPR
jgi:PBP1b-binding outer membrane lipoprotein LpoB